METGTIYMYGKCGGLEMLFVDMDDDYFEYIRVDGCYVSEVPKTMQSMHRSCLHYRTRVSKEFADQWLAN